MDQAFKTWQYWVVTAVIGLEVGMFLL